MSRLGSIMLVIAKSTMRDNEVMLVGMFEKDMVPQTLMKWQ